MAENDDKQKYLIAMVLEDINQALIANRNHNKVHIIASTPNAYYWAYFDDDEEQWQDGFYGDIREAPFFANKVADEKRDILKLLKDRGVVSNFAVNSSKQDPLGMGWKDYTEIDSFDVSVNLSNFVKYYDKYTKAIELHTTTNVGKPTEKIAYVKMDGKELFIGYEGGNMLLQKRVRVDSPLYFLFHYLQSHTNTDVPRATVQSLEACRSISNLTETVRALGFDKHMKAIFFPGTSASRIHFTPKVELTPEQHKLFNKHLDLLKSKS